MTSRSRWVAGLAAGAALWPASLPASAQCETSTFIEIPAGVTTFYYEDRSEYPPVPGNPRLYEETNGVSGIQRPPRPWWDVLELTEPDDQCVEPPTDNPDKRWL